MNLRLNIKDKEDILILYQIINNAQGLAIRNEAINVSNLKERYDKYGDWHGETVDEFARLQMIKDQLKRMLCQDRRLS